MQSPGITTLYLFLLGSFVITIIFNTFVSHRLHQLQGEDQKKGKTLRTPRDVSSKYDNEAIKSKVNLLTEKVMQGDYQHDSKDGSRKSEDFRSESVVFRNILNRALSSKNSCSTLTPSSDDQKVNKVSDIPLLPEFGIANAITTWQTAESKRTLTEHDQCHLPPPTMCDAAGWSVIMMTHGNGHFDLLTRGIQSLTKRPQTKEIILVYNSPRDTFTNDEILRWDKNSNHPLRIFYALEHGLENNLFNRYHPSLKPKMEALLFFDDDGPFFNVNPIEAGFELWKRNSGVQVGCMPRNLGFLNKDGRMKSQMNDELDVVIRQVSNGWQSVSPYDSVSTSKAIKGLSNSDPSLDRHPQFIPSCRSTGGDTLAYRFQEFIPFGAHMTLPSGSFLHRNFLCFLWHPVFEELREYILKHPTHPDDITVSTIVTHVTGKPIKTYSRRSRPRDADMKVEEWEKNRKLPQDYAKDDKYNGRYIPSVLEGKSAKVMSNGIVTYGVNEPKRRLQSSTEEISIVHGTFGNEVNVTTELDQQSLAKSSTRSFDLTQQKRRRLLWNKDEWPNLRTEAANSVIGYFGSINPGSSGYCLGTSHHIDKYKCDNEIHIWDKIPWIWEGGLGNDQC